MARDPELADVLSEFAHTMMTDFPIEAILDRLVTRIVDVLPITGAGVTLISEGTGPHYVAASNTSAMRSEHLQSELQEGPCLAAFHSGTAVSVPDLRQDGRFPHFAAQALEVGLAAVFTFPLGHQGSLLGALDLYRDSPGSLDDKEMATAQTLADVAAAYILNARGRAELVEAAERARNMALHDPLTGLPNRALFLERLEHAVERARRSHRLVAVLFADLDRFKAVNDVHGHEAGDKLLVAFADRLRELLRPGDTLARLAGDEFIVLCEGLTQDTEAKSIVERLSRAMSAPFSLSGVDVFVTASVGVTFAGAGRDVVGEDILRSADAAMYEAKRNGSGRHVIRLRNHSSRAAQEASLSHDLQHAIARDELRLDYQPIVATSSSIVVGFEALVRWEHPRLGLLLPATFIPVAERVELIGPIGAWVLEQACTDLHHLEHLAADPPLRMSINVSPIQLVDAGFPDVVRAALAKTHTAPESVILEVTETVFIRDGERALKVMGDLKELGLALALDDFGTGFSSLSHLHRFPVDVVKIDRSFVAALDELHTGATIVAAVIALAHALGMTATAEGVETADQHRRLAELGADDCQGYYFARPAPVSLLSAGAAG